MLHRLALAVCALSALMQGAATSEAPHTREYFYVGGDYVNTTDGWLFHNQMYVEKLSPSAGSTQPYPIVFLHGGAQTGTVRTLSSWLTMY
jgi:hypothetical protein